MESYRINPLNYAKALIAEKFENDLKIINFQTTIEDYSMNNMVQLLLTKIGNACYQSECLVTKADNIINQAKLVK